MNIRMIKAILKDMVNLSNINDVNYVMCQYFAILFMMLEV